MEEPTSRANNKQNDLCIRPATRADVGTLLALIRALGAYERRPEAVLADEELLRHWLFDEKAAEVLLCEWQGTVAGYALFYPTFSSFLGRPRLYLEDIFIRPELRDGGLGKALLAAVAWQASNRGWAGMQWSCLDWNENAMGFYRSLGAVQKTGSVGFVLEEAATAALAAGADA